MIPIDPHGEAEWFIVALSSLIAPITLISFIFYTVHVNYLCPSPTKIDMPVVKLIFRRRAPITE